MSAAALPIPGLLWGPYPERAKPPRAGELALPAAFKTALDRPVIAWDWARRRRLVAEARAQERSLGGLDAPALQERLRTLRLALRQEGLREAHLATGFALTALACERALGLRIYDTQLIAAAIVLSNQLAEMATGEGKTLAVAIAAATAALAGVPVHVVTANDYLVGRDAALLGPVYADLGLTVGALTQDLDPDARRRVYACDIAYCTAKELVFDYLRDGLVRTREPLRWHLERLCGGLHAQPLLRGLCMAIVDEADSILIDEARVPLILSQSVGNAEEQRFLGQSLALARSLAEGKHFLLEPAALQAHLTPAGAGRLERAAKALPAVWRNRLHREETLRRALAALHLYRRDRHYLVQEGKVLIVDETTGRVAPGRAWSRGLHQLIELKEGLATTAPFATLAQITYQRFFPRYLRLGGLSGTLRESRAELLAVYRLPVRRVPLRRPARRRLLPTRLFPDRDRLWAAVAERAAAISRAGRPVLVGTESVADSEALSDRLRAAGVEHAVLNARHDREEAQLVAGAGAPGRVTVTTNMAGRGTDIALAPGIARLGGLHLLSCQLNAARRIDRQLAGRCARQGDPGSLETWLSVDTALIRRACPKWLEAGLRRSAERLPAVLVRLATRALQRLEEGRHVVERRRLLERDRALERRLGFGRPRE